MQNLALSSQFNNSGRRGSSSSNSFQSLVMNGVLPPNEDGRVEAFGAKNENNNIFEDFWRKIQAWWEGRNSGGTNDSFDKNNPGSGGGNNGIGPSSWGFFGDRTNFGSPVDLTGGSGRGSGGDSDRENWDPHNTGGTIRINYPTPNSRMGYFLPSDEYLEGLARQQFYDRVLANVLNLFEIPQFTNEVFNIVKYSLQNLFDGLKLSDNSFISSFLQALLNKLLYPDPNLIEKIKDYIKSGKFSSNSNIPDFMRQNEIDREKVYFTLFEENFENKGINTIGGFLKSISINMKIEVKGGKTYLTIYAVVMLQIPGFPPYPQDALLYQVEI
jgi:hypothetical protein